MADLIQLRRDVAADWTSANPTLAEGEVGLELDTGKHKIGDGTTAWNSLAYYTGHGSVSITELGYLDGVTSSIQNQLNGKQNWHGFPNNPYTVILSYDAANRTITLTPTGSTFDIWLTGVKFTKTGAQTSPPHTDATGNYFFVYGADGELAVSSSPWDILGAGIPVCYVYYNATLVDGIPLFELHTAKANRSWHKSQHFALGTYIRSGLEVADYTLNSAVDANLTYSIASGIIVDEDIEMTLSALADGGPYTIMRRTGATDWTWTTNNSFPFLFTTNGYIQYNQNNAGSYQMTEAAAARWVNYFVFATTAIPHTLTNGAPVSSSDKRFLVIPSQTIHTSLAAAQAESLANISWGGILIPEIVGAWKWTYETKSNNATTGKVQAVEVSRLTLTRSQLSGNFTAGSHNALTGRDAAESHPATAISNTPAGNIAATTVQAAINELDTEKQAVLVSGTNIKTINSSSLLGSGDVAVQPLTNGLTELSDALVDNDELPVYDTSATANRKTKLSSIFNYVYTKIGAPANHIGLAGGQGFGVGICPETVSGMSLLAGTTDPASDNYGNYQFSDGSIMVWVPAFFYKIGTGSNGLAVNVVNIKPRSAYVAVADANLDGYALHRAFYDGGAEKDGFFVDKYGFSNNNGIASSIALGNPLSSSASHNGWGSLLTGLTTGDNIYAGAIKAAKTRGNDFFACSLPIYAALALLSLAHGQAATSTTHCAWYLANKNYPKGNNNGALRDIDDTSVTFTSDGYTTGGATPAKTGSGNPFAKTTHNGQNCGIADLNGNLWEVAIGLTCIATSKTMTAASKANPCQITIAGHGYTTGDILLITSVGGMTELNDKLYTITVTGNDTFTLNGVDSTAYTTYTSGGSATKGAFYAAKTSVAMKDFTSGNTLATDHWGATGVAAMMEAITPNFVTTAGVNGITQRYGNSANQVLAENTTGADWARTGLMLPKSGGVSVSGITLFGTDLYYQYIRNELCSLVGGGWGNGSYAGVWLLDLSSTRGLSYASAGGRAGLYI